MKQQSTIAIWQNHKNILSKNFWKEHTFWSDGYFVCSIGEARPDTVRQYILSQG
ncbi:MAG: transposase [Bacteroidota bacterium]|nr:transposase [Bacteroidota bacterium]